MILTKRYDPESVERHWQGVWEHQKYRYTASHLPPRAGQEELTMDEAFRGVLLDILVRYTQMRSIALRTHPSVRDATGSPPITGSPPPSNPGQGSHTAANVSLKSHAGKSRERLTREKSRLGIMRSGPYTCPLSHTEATAALTETFVHLFNEGVIYRSHRMVHWDPIRQDISAEIETHTTTEEGYLWYLRCPLVDSAEDIHITTTRPETLLAVTGFAVNPKDTRWTHLVGQRVKLPLTERWLPIVGDKEIDPDFGSGCVSLAPAHDFHAHSIAQRHGMEPIDIFGVNGRTNDNVPERYRGLNRVEARQRVTAEVSLTGCLVRSEPHPVPVLHNASTGAKLEPFSIREWFIRTKGLVHPALEALQKTRIEFAPPYWAQRLRESLEWMQDWRIASRTHGSHRIPAWYDEQGRVLVARNEFEVRRMYGLDDALPLTRDVCHFSHSYVAALAPVLTVGWSKPSRTAHSPNPHSLLMAAPHDSTWVANTLLLSVHFLRDIPFQNICVHRLQCDATHGPTRWTSVLDRIDGVTPEQLISRRSTTITNPHLRDSTARTIREKLPNGIPGYGADAMRFALAEVASVDREIVHFHEDRLLHCRNFCNKLWNIARFVLMHTAHQDVRTITATPRYTLPDRWIRSRLESIKASTVCDLDARRLDRMARCLRAFTWQEFGNGYLELAKIVLVDTSAPPARKRATLDTLIDVLGQTLQLLHPVIPHITAELWRKLASQCGRSVDAITWNTWPTPDATRLDHAAEADIEWLQRVIHALRHTRSALQLPPSQEFEIALKVGEADDRRRYRSFRIALSGLVNVRAIDCGSAIVHGRNSLVTWVGSAEFVLFFGSLIDSGAGIAYVDQRTRALTQRLDSLTRRLDDIDSLNRAPHNVVQRWRNDQARTIYRLDDLHRRRQNLERRFSATDPE